MNASSAKAITCVALFIITIILGIIPYFIIRHGGNSSSRLRNRALSLLKCFSGGVFLGACLLHLLVEGKEALTEVLENSYDFHSYPVFELLVGAGFLLIAIIEQLILFCLTGWFSSGSEKAAETAGQTCTSSNSYSVSTRDPAKEEHVNKVFSMDNEGDSTVRQHQCNGLEGNTDHSQHHRDDRETSPHPEHVDMVIWNTAGTTSNIRALLFLAALSFHTIFDGLAVGLQSEVTEVWEVFAAITIHKSVVAFSIGLQLFTAFKRKLKLAIGGLIVFALMSPLGIGLGIAITSPNVDSVAQSMASGVLQALASGSFLFVTCFEILQEELSHSASFVKVAMVAVGFGAMAGIKALDSH